MCNCEIFLGFITFAGHYSILYHLQFRASSDVVIPPDFGTSWSLSIVKSFTITCLFLFCLHFLTDKVLHNIAVWQYV